MLAELRKKSQITIPKDIIKKMGLEEGNQFEIVEKNGIIELIPVAIYPKSFKKHFAKLNSIEKNQVKNKLEIHVENPSYIIGHKTS